MVTEVGLSALAKREQVCIATERTSTSPKRNYLGLINWRYFLIKRNSERFLWDLPIVLWGNFDSISWDMWREKSMISRRRSNLITASVPQLSQGFWEIKSRYSSLFPFCTGMFWVLGLERNIIRLITFHHPITLFLYSTIPAFQACVKKQLASGSPHVAKFNMADGSQLFSPFRALGFVANHVPLTIQTQGTENLVTTAVGSAFHVYNVSEFCLFWLWFQ